MRAQNSNPLLARDQAKKETAEKKKGMKWLLLTLGAVLLLIFTGGFGLVVLLILYFFLRKQGKQERGKPQSYEIRPRRSKGTEKSVPQQVGLSQKKQLEQLNSLYSAGMMEMEEYLQRKGRILRGE